MEEPNLMQNQQSPVQEEAQPTKGNFTPTPKKVWRRAPKFIAVIVVLLVVGGAAYGYATYLAKKNFNEVVRLAEEGKRQAEEFEQKRQAGFPRDEVLRGWQTYRNEEYGFEVKYPPNFSAELSKTNVLQIAENPGDYEFPGVWIYLYENPDNLSAETWWKTTADYDPKNETIELLTIASQPAIKIMNYISFAGEVDIIIAHKGKIYRILELPTNEKFNQILSTFKFIEPGSKEGEVCIQVITPARNPQTGETRDFPTPCDVPEGWEVVR